MENENLADGIVYFILCVVIVALIGIWMRQIISLPIDEGQQLGSLAVSGIMRGMV